MAWYKHVAYDITLAISHNIDDSYRNIHRSPPTSRCLMPPFPPHWVGWWGMDIAIRVVNVSTYCKCHGIGNILVSLQTHIDFIIAVKQCLHLQDKYNMAQVGCVVIAGWGAWTVQAVYTPGQ